MTYTDFSRRAFPVTLAIAMGCAAWAWKQGPTSSPVSATTLVAESSALPPDTTAPVSTPTAPPAPAMPNLTLPPAGAILTATPGPVPQNPTESVATEGKVWLSEFDRALDQEFTRLEARETASRDPVELALVARLKEKLLALDDIWRRADALRAVEEKMKLQHEAQQLMGEIIQLGRADRNQRLTQLARSVGVAPGEATARFIEEADRAFVETHLDWARLFNRGVVTSGE